MTRVLCDVDGVLADFQGCFLWAASEITGEKYLPDDVTTWDFKDCLGLSAGQERAALKLVAGRLDFDELPGGCDAVRKIRQASDLEVVFVTSPHLSVPGWVEARAKWLEKRFPGAPVVHTKRKEYVSGDFLIDDKSENALDWSLAYPQGRAILFAAPYNDARRPPWVIRTSDWAEILELVGAA